MEHIIYVERPASPEPLTIHFDNSMIQVSEVPALEKSPVSDGHHLMFDRSERVEAESTGRRERRQVRLVETEVEVQLETRVIVEVPIEIEVDRIVQVDRIVEVPVDKIIEVPVDRIVEVEKIVEKVVEVVKIVERIV